MAKKKNQLSYFVCGACRCAITQEQIDNKKARRIFGVLVHDNCPTKILADFRQATLRIFSSVAELPSIKDWALQKMEEVKKITVDGLKRIEAFLVKVAEEIKQVIATAILYKDQKTQTILKTAATEIQKIHCHCVFWKPSRAWA